MTDQLTTVPASPSDAPAETEVDYVPGAPVEGIDQAPDAPRAEEAQESAQDVINLLRPKAETRVWKFGPAPDGQREYTQRPLSTIGKMQWFALVGGIMDEALSGPSAMSFNSLFNAPVRDGQVDMQAFRNADTFVQAVGKLLSVAPKFIEDSLAIWLAVPDYEEKVFRLLINSPEDEGGLSDDQFFEIVEVFIDQNYGALASFFQRAGGLQARVEARAKELAEARGGSQSSKR